MIERFANWLKSWKRPVPVQAWLPTGRIECWQAHPDLPVEVMMEMIQRSPPCLWPSSAIPGHGFWHEWANVQAAHRELMRRYVASVPPYPAGKYAGRGIVICAGGWKFLPSVYITVRMIRHHGCTLPIELWHLDGEHDDKQRYILSDYGVKWVNANEHARQSGTEPRYLGTAMDGVAPWEIKAYSVLHSSFAEVLSLDADSYPVRDPSFLFDHPAYTSMSAMFWPDGAQLGDTPDGVWRAFGIALKRQAQFESGQFVVNKERAWKAVNLAWWLNEHRDYVYRVPGIYGDKDTFNVAWNATKTPFHLVKHYPAHVVDMYFQRDLEGKTLFVHRHHNKWKLGGERGFMSQQGTTTRIEKQAPHEMKAAAWMTELDQLVNPAADDRRNFRLRPGTTDETVWESVVLRNEYRLPAQIEPGTVVIDVGANVGAFAHACLSRGAEFVHCVEPEPGNITSLVRNMERWRDKTRMWYGAAWRSDKRERRVGLSRLAAHPSGFPTAQFAIAGIEFDGHREDAGSVSAIRLDTLILAAKRQHPGKRLVIKLDCEGGEYAMLSTSRRLDKIASMCGEYHRVEWNDRAWGPDDIRTSLGQAGFTVTFEDETKSNGLFWAVRDCNSGTLTGGAQHAFGS